MQRQARGFFPGCVSFVVYSIDKEARKLEIAIIGAGVGGLATAVALRNTGYKVTIYERNDRSEHLGAGVVLWPNACFVLDQLGLLDAARGLSGTPKSMCRYSSEGESLGGISLQNISDIMGYPCLSILRRDLIAILTRAVCKLGIPINFNTRVEGIEDQREGAQLMLSDGSSRSADLIIGADGRMQSIARRYVCGDNSPVFQHFLNWVGIFESDEPWLDDVQVYDYWGVGKRFGIVPINNRQAYWAAGTHATEPAGVNTSVSVEYLQSLFRGWPRPVVRILEGIAEPEVRTISVHDHHPTNVWYRRNLLVIGDAAHAALPTSGQGACQALEDAWMLATLLSESGTSIEQILGHFQQLRQPKTRSIIQAGRSLARSIFNPDPVICASRNRESKVQNYRRVEQGMAATWMTALPL